MVEKDIKYHVISVWYWCDIILGNMLFRTTYKTWVNRVDKIIADYRNRKFITTYFSLIWIKIKKLMIMYVSKVLGQ